MIYIYGDSHAYFSFKNLNIPHIDKHNSSITMFRIGRDNHIINLNNNQHTDNDIIVLCYGEVDCRCHIQKQINLGNNEDDIIFNLVNKYFTTISSNIKIYKYIIIVGIIPPTEENTYYKIHGPITHEFPFVGTDTDRVRFTLKANNLIKKYCTKYEYIYFNPYDYYTQENGCLKPEFSDTIVHIGNNMYFLDQFNYLINNLSKI